MKKTTDYVKLTRKRAQELAELTELSYELNGRN
jgi:hypothetical protein